MPEAEGALMAPLDEIHGPWAEGWGWPPITATGEDADVPPPAEEEAATEANIAEDEPAPTGSASDLLPVFASEDVFRFDFTATAAAAEEAHDPAPTEGITLDRIDIAALIAGGEAMTFLANWDFGVVTVQVQASEGPAPEDGGQGFEVVLSAVGGPEVNASWL